MDLKTKKLDELRRHVEASQANGWYATSASGGLVIRMTVHETPEFAKKAGWWPGDTYHYFESIDFTFTRGTDRVPLCIYRRHLCPWNEAEDGKISYRAALALLAEPLSESPIHN